MNALLGHKQFIAEFLRLPVERVREESLIGDLVADSFQAVELLVALQEEFTCTLSHADLIDIEKLGDLLAILQKKIASGER